MGEVGTPAHEVIFVDIEERCPRCGHSAVTIEGVCKKCAFKCWYGYH